VGELLFFRSQLDRVSLFDSLVSYCRFSLLFVHYFVLSQLNHFRLGDHIETSCSAHGRLVTPRCVAFVYRNPVALGSLGSVQQQSDLSFLLSHVLVFQLPAAACSRFPLLHGSYSCLLPSRSPVPSRRVGGPNSSPRRGSLDLSTNNAKLMPRAPYPSNVRFCSYFLNPIPRQMGKNFPTMGN